MIFSKLEYFELKAACRDFWCVRANEHHFNRIHLEGAEMGVHGLIYILP